MADTVTIRGTGYSLPVVGDKSWGDSLSAFLLAIPRATRTAFTFGNSSSGTCAGTATYYLSPVFGDSASGVSEYKQPAPFAGIIRDLYVIENTPHTTNTVTYTVRVNGVATAITCATASTVGTGSDTTHSATVVAGDYISVSMTANSQTVDPSNVIVVLTLTME